MARGTARRVAAGFRRVAAGFLLAAAAAAGAGCAGPERSGPPVEEELYVEVMARLAAIRAASDPGRREEPLSGGRADSLRRSVLTGHGVSRSDLEAFARVVGDEPVRMQSLWKRIGERADSLTEAGWPVDTAAAAADSAGGGPDSLPSDVDTSGTAGGGR